jgi:DNA-binding response OmpR family regulator
MPETKKVLVVDDDPDIQLSCRIVLEQAGYTVVSAMNSVDGRRMVDGERPDIVLLDVMMEAADSGLLMARWMAAHHQETPVMVLSSIADAAGQVFDTSTLPVADLVNKPVRGDDLLAGIKRLLDRAARR